MIQRKHSAQADLNLRLSHMSKDEDTFSDIGLQSAIPIQIAGLTTVLQTVMNYIRKKSHAQLNNGCNENSKSIINPMGVILTLIESRKFHLLKSFFRENVFGILCVNRPLDKSDNFCDYRFAFMHTKLQLKSRELLKKIFPFHRGDKIILI